MHALLIRPRLGHALWLALVCLVWSYGAAQAESSVYTDTVPTQPVRWTDSLTVPQFDPALGILTSVELTLTGNITGTTSYTNQVNAVTQVSIDIPSNLRLQTPTNALLNAGSTVLSFTENLPPFGSGSRAFSGTVTSGVVYTAPPALAAFSGLGQVTMPVTATSTFIAGGDVGNFDFRIRTVANATGIVRYQYTVPRVNIKKFTNGFDADDPNGDDVPQVQPGAIVTWTYQVTNTGSITIPEASLVVTDSQSGVTPRLDRSTDRDGDQALAPGEVWIFIATGTVEDLTMPTTAVTRVNGCNPAGTAAPGFRAAYRNIGVVTAPGTQAQDPSHYCNPDQPGIVIKKYTNGLAADQPNARDVPQLQPGTPVTWTYVVTNTGNLTFTFASVVVTDSHPTITPRFVAASDANGDGLLSPGEQWRYVATGVVEDLDIPTQGTTIVSGCNAADTLVPGERPTYVNVGAVTVPGATASDPSHYCNPPVPAIDLEKTVYRGLDGGASCPGDELVADQVNSAVTYCFTITNTGETYLDSLVFTDTILGIDLAQLTLLSGATPLAPNATLRYFYPSTIPTGERVNLAAVAANPTDDQGRDLPGLPNPDDEDTATVRALPTGLNSPEEPTNQHSYLPLLYR